MPELTRFQDAFVDALRGEPGAMAPWLENPAAPALAVYQNTTAAGAVDALAAVYTTVVRLVGLDWFRGAARAYAVASPPREPSLLAFGEDFADWLASFPPAADAPYLAGVARLDRLWWDAYFAADGPVLQPADLARIIATGPEDAAFVLHPSVRLAAFEQNLVSLWLAQRDPSAPATIFEIEDHPEQAVIARRGLQVDLHRVAPPTYAFLDACRSGASLQTAIDAAAAAGRLPAAQIIADSLQSGLIGRGAFKPEAPHDA